jgi:hypothetical protein
MPPTGDSTLPSASQSPPDPAADFAFEAEVDRVAREKQLARELPDVPWRIWWFHSGSKWYIVTAFLVLDVWLAALVFGFGSIPLIVGLVAVAVYAEFLLYRYLYYVPEDGERRRGPFRPTWSRPVQYGRWTAEGETVRAGGTVAPSDGPDPKEFL